MVEKLSERPEDIVKRVGEQGSKLSLTVLRGLRHGWEALDVTRPGHKTYFEALVDDGGDLMTVLRSFEHSVAILPHMPGDLPSAELFDGDKIVMVMDWSHVMNSASVDYNLVSFSAIINRLHPVIETPALPRAGSDEPSAMASASAEIRYQGIATMSLNVATTDHPVGEHRGSMPLDSKSFSGNSHDELHSQIEAWVRDRSAIAARVLFREFRNGK